MKVTRMKVTRMIENTPEYAIFEGEYGQIYMGKIYRFMNIDGIFASLKTNKMRYKNPFFLNDPFELLNYQINWDKYIEGFKVRKGNFLVEKLIYWILDKYNIPENKTKKINELVTQTVSNFDNVEVKNAIIDSFVSLIGEEFSKDFDSKILEMKNQLKNQVKLCSFSKSYNSNNSKLMWSHYADNHNGACLEFNLGELWRVSMENSDHSIVNESIVPHIVEYKNKLQELQLGTDREFYRAIKCKQQEWSYEEEVRLIHMSDNTDEFEDINFPFSHLSKVIFGLNMSQDNINKIIDSINNNEEVTDIKYEKMSLKEETGILAPLPYEV